MRRSGGPLLAAFAVAASGSVAAAQPAPVVTGPFAPADRCARLPGATGFRVALAHAVWKRDAAALAALANPSVKLDLGGGSSRAELRRRLTGADGQKLWRELDRILPLGCAVQQGNLVMPGMFAHDFGDTEAFDVMVVTGARVPLRAAPDPAARPLRLLSWVAVTPLGGDDSDKLFRKVRVGPVTGYVETARLRAPLDYRLVASRYRGAWRIDAFVAGD